MNNYKYAGIETYDINNGKGFGVTVFVQGCPHHCVGCHNPQTWNYNGGYDYTSDTETRLLNVLKNDNINRLTLSGGEPFTSISLCQRIIKLFKENCPDKSIWIYSGYTYEELTQSDSFLDLLQNCNVLVDGVYDKRRTDLSLPFRGSSNQRIIDVQSSLLSGSVVLYDIGE